MFNFNNLEDIDNNDAAPEWQKWEGKADWQRAGLREDWAVLEDQREEQFAAAEEDEYVYEKLEIPFLPEDCFDPMGLADDTIEAVEEQLACLNGQVIMNYVAGAFEEYLMNEFEKEQKKQYVESLHQERLAVLESSGFKAKTEQGKAHTKFDRKKFSWREIQTPLIPSTYGLPDGGNYAEVPITGDRVLKACMKISGVSVLPNSALIQMACSMGNQTRPMPSGRMGRNATWYLMLSDLFFPTPFILEEGRDYYEFRKEHMTPICMALMSCHKEAGDIEAKNLLEGVKLASPASFGFKRPGLSAITE